MSVEERPICRRCKKKRPLDEPLETARYRTCKPCREIERKKKRLKKLEQTGGIVRDATGQIEVLPKPNSYVDQTIINIANQVQRAHQLPHQYQQYQQLPPVLAPIHQQQQDAQQQQQQHQLLQQQQQQVQAAAAQQAQNAHDQAQHAAAQAQAAAAVAVAQKQEGDIPIDELLLKQGTGDDQDKHHHSEISAEAIEAIARGANVKDDDKDTQDNDDSNLFAALKNANKSADDEEVDNNARLDSHPLIKEDDSNICLYCGAVRDIADNGRYQLCGNCVENPLETDNVFDDFNSYLARIALGKIADMKNLIFIKKFEDADFISDFETDANGNNNLDTIVEQLNNQFINPLIENSGFKFSKSSSNLSVKPQPKSIKLLFKCKQDIKTMQKTQNPSMSRLKTEDCQSNVYISYDIFSKNLSIKFNHRNHKPFLEKTYSTSLIDRVREVLKTESDLNEVYNVLRANSYLSTIDDEGLKNEIIQLKKVNFVKDFSNF